MNFDSATDTVIGYVDCKKGENSAQLIVIGYLKSDGLFVKGNVEFPPNGKVFCPSFFAIESLPDSYRRTKAVVKFSCIWSKEDTTNSYYDRYHVDLNNPLVPLPRLLAVSWTEDTIGLSEKTFEDCLSIDGCWQAYPYNPETGTLYEEVKFDEGKFFPVKGKEIRGFPLHKDLFERFSVGVLPSIEYCLPHAIQSVFTGDPKHSIDFMTIHQLKRWIKEKLNEYAKLDQGLMQQIRTQVNALPEEVDELDRIRLKRANLLLKNLDLTDKELCTMIASNTSSIGMELHNQIVSLKETYVEDWKKELLGKFERERIELDLKNAGLSKQANDIEQQIALLETHKKSLETEIRKQDEVLESQRSELKVIDENRTLIVSTLKVMANGSPFSQIIHNPVNTSRVQRALIFSVEKRDSVFPPTEDDDLEEYLIRTLKRGLRIDNDSAQSVINVFKNRASFIPSVSWAYALAYLLGNTKVMNLTVEYDWLHFSDFCEHGLLEFWSMAYQQPETTFILVLQNINIVPSECSLLPLLEVLSGIRPTLEGTQYDRVPSNLYCLATVCSSSGDHAMGIPLKKELFQSWGAFIASESSGSINYHSLMQIDVGISPKMIEDLLFGHINPDLQTNIDGVKASHYVS